MTVFAAPLGGNVIHKNFRPDLRREISGVLTAKHSVQSGSSREGPCKHAPAICARHGAPHLADRFVALYVNHWTLDYGEPANPSPRVFGSAFERGLIPHRAGIGICRLILPVRTDSVVNQTRRFILPECCRGVHLGNDRAMSRLQAEQHASLRFGNGQRAARLLNCGFSPAKSGFA